MSQRILLEDLPNELLYDIISHLSDLTSIPERSSSLCFLSQVNKHLRDQSLPFLFRKLGLNDYDMWKPMIKYFTTKGKQNASYVRSIRFLTCPRSNIDHHIPYIALGPDAQPRLIFPNLQSFECLGDLLIHSTYRRVRIDLPYKELRHLTIVYQCSRLFPPVERFPRLKSLRILLSSARIHGCTCPNCIKLSMNLSSGPYNSISRLSIETNAVAKWPPSIWTSLQFPNLKIFSCRILEDRCVYPIYAFVQRHSTLLEVNLGFEDTDLRLEGLIKLIEGTGRWEVPEGVELTPQSFVPGPTRALDAAALIDSGLPFPDDFPGRRVLFSEFGFVREPITVEGRSPRDPLDPQFKIIALALKLESIYVFDCAYIEDFLLLSGYFPDVEELRLKSDTSSQTFESWTTQIGTKLSRWRRLRKFTFGCSDPDDWKWRPIEHEVLLSEVTPVLEEVFPPADFSHNTRGIGLTLAVVRALQGTSYVDKIKARIKRDLPRVLPLDENDDWLLTKCWRDLHHEKVKWAVSLFSANCPSLEEVEWYPPGFSSWYDEHDSYSAWKWKICPCSTGSPKSIVGDFHFVYDRDKLTHEIFDILVGEELRCVEQLRERCLY